MYLYIHRELMMMKAVTVIYLS